MTDFEWGPKRWLRRPGPESLGQTIATHRNNYNLIRLFLAGSVILFHSFALTKSAGWTDYADAALSMIDLDLGGVAVYGFFFLSGLFVAQSFFRDKSVINFAVRRFCRLWPGLFACVGDNRPGRLHPHVWPNASVLPAR